MSFSDAMRALREAGTAQNRKVYARHGVTDEMFGVSYKDLAVLSKRFGPDSALAAELWDSGNHDARVLATQIARAEDMTSTRLDQWARDLSSYVITDAFSKLAADAPSALRKMDRWTRSRGEWRCRAGWLLVAHLARKDGALTDARAEELLAGIESGIHGSKNRARDAMNSALIAIGLRGPALERMAVAAAKRIGKVEVDHGQTSCKTPDAVAYIAKAKARRRP